MKLVHKETGKEVEAGDAVTSFRGDKYTVVSVVAPRYTNGTGRVYVSNNNGAERGYYPSVFNCEWRD